MNYGYIRVSSDKQTVENQPREHTRIDSVDVVRQQGKGAVCVVYMEKFRKDAVLEV